MQSKGLCLIQFAKRPIAGLVKTRLMPELGAEGALQVHEELLALTLKVLCESEIGHVQLWWDDDWRWEETRRLADGIDASIRRMPGQFVQQGDDLGTRMYHALDSRLAEYNKVLLVGSDCPVLSKEYLLHAAAVLEQKDIVLGPSNDGGYVLIGARKLRGNSLASVSWGKETVLAETLASFGNQGLSHGLIEPLYDVDDISDYRRWRASIAAC